MIKFNNFRCLFIIFYVVLTTGCNNSNSDNRQIITLWHFWSEPQQKATLQVQISEFEKLYPNLKVELTELQWSDGKTKLMLGFNAQSAPDVVQLGFEWMPEFINSNVLSSLSDSLTKDSANYFSPSLQSLISKHKLYALPWTINTRAMLLFKQTSSNNAIEGKPYNWKLTWDDLRELKNRNQLPYFWGINSSEPHNVLKKALPIIWSAGSKLFTSTPLSDSFDSSSVSGLEFYLELSKGGIQQQSRILDDMFLQNKIEAWISGQWILDKAKQHYKESSFRVLSQIPTKSESTIGYSILGGDCLAVSRQSKHRKSAELLIQFLTNFKQSSKFCDKISDAGFPASKDIFNATYCNNFDFNRWAFLKQIQNSRPLPSSPIFLDAERILEEEIMNAVYLKKSAKDALQSARMRIKSLETSFN